MASNSYFVFRKSVLNMKILYFLGVIYCFTICLAESDVNEYCEEQCKNVCIPCQEPVRCTQNQTDCGLGEPDENFGGVCPPHSICVEPEFHCKMKHKNDLYLVRFDIFYAIHSTFSETF